MANYRILRNEKFGRYMVSSKRLKAGEFILSEKPTIIGPQIDGALICFNCCKNVYKTGYIFCRSCNAAILCSPKCSGKFHTEHECSKLKKYKIPGLLFERNREIVLPLRCLLLRENNIETWKTMVELEPHLDSRRNTAIWKTYKTTVEDVLRPYNLVSPEEENPDVIQTICGILDVNTFEVRPPSIDSSTIRSPEKECLRGLYLTAALMAHDCVGNTLLSVDDDFILTIKASTDILKGSPIFFNYSNTLHGSTSRREHLKEGKYFDCFCARCLDNTEMGTEISSLKCHKCNCGWIRLIQPENLKSDWHCSNCKRTFKDCLIKSTVEEGRRLIDEADNSSVFDVENLHKTLLQTFHPNHYVMLELKQNLASLYMQLPPNKRNLSRKIQLCQEIEEVISKLEPGISRLRAIILYQLQTACVDLAHKQYQNKDIDIEELIAKLLTAETKLKEAVKYLLHEPMNSPEGRVAQMALSELKMLKLSVTNIQRDFLNSSSKLNLSNKITQDSPGMAINDDEIKENIQDVAHDEVNSASNQSKRRRNRKKKKH